MKFSSTDKRSETVSLIRNKKKIYFIGRNKCIIKKIECWPVFKQDPQKQQRIPLHCLDREIAALIPPHRAHYYNASKTDERKALEQGATQHTMPLNVDARKTRCRPSKGRRCIPDVVIYVPTCSCADIC